MRRKSWKDYIKELTDQSLLTLLRIADDNNRWPAITTDSSVGVTEREAVGWQVKLYDQI